MRAQFIRKEGAPSERTINNKLVEAESIYLLGPKLYGLKKHLKLKGEEIKRATNDSFKLLDKYGVPFSASAIVNEIEKHWKEKRNSYEMSEYLKRDSNFRREGKMLLRSFKMEEA